MSGEFDETFDIVFLCRVLRPDETASRAFVNNPISSGRNGDTAWIHRSPAEGSAVPRVNIDMFAPQALWAVIRVAASRYTCTAVFAHKILYFSSETHGGLPSSPLRQSAEEGRIVE